MASMMTPRCIVHVDMDAFFASIEQLDDPSLRGLPVLVGGAGARGVVAAASYEARAFGCRSAMPMVRARVLCPQAIVVAPHRRRYQEASATIFEIFRRYTPVVEGLSLDEAFLDVTGSRAIFGLGSEIATRIRQDIQEETGLTASAGVAPNKFVAKIASDYRKPDGLTVVEPGQVQRFLWPLPLRRMWGVGEKAAQRLREAGYRTIGDLAAAPRESLVHYLGAWGDQVHELAHGRDQRPVTVGSAAKSLGAEDTFSSDIKARAELERVLLAQSERVAQRLVRQGVSARVVTVKIKYPDFRQRTRQRKLEASIADTQSIHEVAVALLDRFPDLHGGVRLTGVSVSEIVEAPPEKTLFARERQERRHALEEVTAQLRDRFGKQGLKRASLLEDPVGEPDILRREPDGEPSGPER